MEELSQAVLEAAEVAAPIDFKTFIDGPLRRGRSGKIKFEVLDETRPKRVLVERNVAAFRDFNGSFEEELLEVGPEIIGHQDLWSAKVWKRRIGNRNDFFRTRPLGFTQLIGKEVNESRHLYPLN